MSLLLLCLVTECPSLPQCVCVQLLQHQVLPTHILCRCSIDTFMYCLLLTLKRFTWSSKDLRPLLKSEYHSDILCLLRKDSPKRDSGILKGSELVFPRWKQKSLHTYCWILTFSKYTFIYSLPHNEFVKLLFSGFIHILRSGYRMH